MIIEILSAVCFGCAAIPALLCLINLWSYRRLPGAAAGFKPTSEQPEISVLIPARNEAENIETTLRAVLANRGVSFEVLVLDDHSTDQTATLVGDIAAADRRVRLMQAPELPDGWCGKQHACHVLAKGAQGPLMLFLDADVRLAPDALARISRFMADSQTDLASGVPRQDLGTFSERLLIPFIHFLLLGFLPIYWMRRSRREAFGAGCGQLMVARSTAYVRAGGHQAIKASLHDGIKLPRIFRAAGFRTDLFDATDVAVCRMYKTNRDVWTGLGKNATEGLGHPRAIVPMTLLLLLGQVLPAFLCIFLFANTSIALLAGATMLGFLTRAILARRFYQPFVGVVLHPVGVVALLWIQWQALFRQILGMPSQWKGRFYGTPFPTGTDLNHAQSTKPGGPGLMKHIRATAGVGLGVLILALLCWFSLRGAESEPGGVLKTFRLPDQFGNEGQCVFPSEKPTILIIADRQGSEHIAQWVAPLKKRYDSKIVLEGIADVSKVPGPLRSFVSVKIKKSIQHPVLLDWNGSVTSRFKLTAAVPNVFLISTNGQRLFSVSAVATQETLENLFKAVDKAL